MEQSVQPEQVDAPRDSSESSSSHEEAKTRNCVVANDARQQLPQSVQVVVIDDDRESQARRSQSNRESNSERQRSNAQTQCPPPVTAELAEEVCVPNERSLHMNIKLEPDSQQNATLHSPACPSQ